MGVSWGLMNVKDDSLLIPFDIVSQGIFAFCHGTTFTMVLVYLSFFSFPGRFALSSGCL